jgi:hypothetical protein
MLSNKCSQDKWLQILSQLDGQSTNILAVLRINTNIQIVRLLQDMKTQSVKHELAKTTIVRPLLALETLHNLSHCWECMLTHTHSLMPHQFQRWRPTCGEGRARRPGASCCDEKQTRSRCSQYSNDDPRKKQPVCLKLAGMLTRTKHAEHMQDNVWHVKWP